MKELPASINDLSSGFHSERSFLDFGSSCLTIFTCFGCCQTHLPPISARFLNAILQDFVDLQLVRRGNIRLKYYLSNLQNLVPSPFHSKIGPSPGARPIASFGFNLCNENVFGLPLCTTPTRCSHVVALFFFTTMCLKSTLLEKSLLSKVAPSFAVFVSINQIDHVLTRSTYKIRIYKKDHAHARFQSRRPSKSYHLQKRYFLLVLLNMLKA